MKDLQSLPKVVLHDHLDGGLRPGTILDLAQSIGYQGLPAADEESLSRLFYPGAARSLEACAVGSAGREGGGEAFGGSSGLIVDALRHNDDSVEVAQVAAGFAGRGVV